MLWYFFFHFRAGLFFFFFFFHFRQASGDLGDGPNSFFLSLLTRTTVDIEKTDDFDHFFFHFRVGFFFTPITRYSGHLISRLCPKRSIWLVRKALAHSMREGIGGEEGIEGADSSISQSALGPRRGERDEEGEWV